MSIRKFTLVATLGSLCALAGVLALAGVAAQAAVKHEFLPAPSAKLSEDVPAQGPLGESVPVPGPLFKVNSMAVDAGNVYIAEEPQNPFNNGTYRLDKYNASTGAFVSQFPQVPSVSFLYSGLAVGHANGDVYVSGDEFPEGAPHGVVAVFSATGSPLAVWKGAGTPSFEGTKAFACFQCNGDGSVAVDNSSSLSWAAGDVYVADPLHGVVDVFKPETGGGEEFVTQLTGPEPPGVLFSRPLSVAANPTNDEVLVADERPNEEEDVVDIFKPAAIAGQYEFAGTLTAPGVSFERVRHITVDGGNGDIYVSEQAIVYQFNSAGELLGTLTGSPTLGFSYVYSLAVDPESHHVFVGDRHEDKQLGLVDVFGPNIVIPDVATEAASNVGTTSATLNGAVDLDKEGQATCQFVYGTSAEFGQTAPCPAPVTEEGSVAVHSELTGLQPDTTYLYRLQATDKNGINPGEPRQDREFTTLGPGLHGESASAVGSSSATLNATIDPRKSPTSYYFQYGTSTGYGSQTPVAPGASIGSGEGDVEVSRHLQGLLAGTVYHYRAVVLSEPSPGVVETFDEPDQTFTTQVVVLGSALPDGRQWEMVSPPNKHGARIAGIGSSLIQASASGDAITYSADNPPEGGVQGYVLEAQIFSTRGPAGWSSQDISLPNAAAATISDNEDYRLFSEDLSLGEVARNAGPFTSLSPNVSPPDTENTPYIRHNFTCGATPAGCFEPLLTGAPGYADVPPGTKFGGDFGGETEVQGGTPDLAHVMLRSLGVALTSKPTQAGATMLYEWSAGKPPAEALQPVSVLPDGEMSSSSFVNAGTEGRYAGRHEISDDGTRIVWSYGGTGVFGHLYLRDMTRGETVQLDAVQSGAGEGAEQPLFQAASSDGSRVFFTDNQKLTKDSGQLSGRPDLYECAIVEVAGKLHCELSDLTPVKGGEGTGVLLAPIIGASEDGSWVYFMSNGVLAEHAVPGDCIAGTSQPGVTCNLYVWHNGVTKLVAVLSGQDQGNWQGHLADATVRVSPTGDWLAFMSQRSLTGYNTRDAISGELDEEVYLYNAETGKIVCASCNPTGARPDGVESQKLLLGGISGDTWKANQWLAGSLPSWKNTTTDGGFSGAGYYQSRYLLDSGRLFFNSSDALVPQDSNGSEDVYQYEPAGVGSCSTSSPTFSEGSGGCVDLISSGIADGESAFLDASANGNDVFFMTHQPIVPHDTDTALDVYDAHVCTDAVPCISSPASPPPCVTADACRAAPLPQPSIFGAPSSATFSGAGNVVSPGSAPATTVKKSLTRAQKLARALKACRKKPKGRKRAACERKSRKQFGATKANAKRRSGR